MNVRTLALASVLTGVLAGVAACAQPGIPPGGPEDKAPPALVSVSPDTGSLNVRPKRVVLRFDEVINERSTPVVTGAAGTARATVGVGGGSSSGNQSASTLGTLVVVSPGDGRERVSWRRTAIEIEPRGGFRPNTTYRVTLLPGLGDLRGNTLKEQVEIVFSTGAARTTSSVTGAMFDWVAAKPAARARVEVFAPTDSTLRWSALTDSLGRFTVRDLAPGAYRVRGWLDTDNDRALDPRESFDSLTVTVDTMAPVELYAFVHDTLGPRIESLEAIDSTAVRIRFDRGIALDWAPDALTVLMLRADSAVVPLGRMVPAAGFDSARKAIATRADSVRRASDTTAAPTDSAAKAAADSLARAAAALGVRPPTRAAPRIQTVRDGLDLQAPLDTLPRVPPPKMNRAAPIVSWVVEYADPLPPGTYVVKIRGVRSLTGFVRPSERELRIRPPAAPADSTAAPTVRPAPIAPIAPTRPPR